MKYTGIAFFDMDGVLANCRHRLKYVEADDYDNFYKPENIALDSVIIPGKKLEKTFLATGYKIVIITSRRSYCLEATMKWLKDNGFSEINEEDVYMRGFGDTRKSWEVKKDLLDNAIKDNMDLVMEARTNFFVDDYPENCKIVADHFMDIQPLIFGLGRLGDKGSEL